MSPADTRARLPPEYRIGTMPSQRADLATGRGAGSTPPTQTGMRGCCTGRGEKRTGSTVKCWPRSENCSPVHSPARTSSPSSTGQDIEPLVEKFGADPLVRRLVEDAEVAVGRRADPHTQGQPPPAQPVQRGGLLGQLPGPPARHRRDQRSDADPRGAGGHHGENLPGVHDGRPLAAAGEDDVIPEALREAFSLTAEQLFVPAEYAWCGAIGTAILEAEEQRKRSILDVHRLRQHDVEESIQDTKPLSTENVVQLRDRVGVYVPPPND